MNNNYAYCTLVGTDDYVIGAMCLAESYSRLSATHDFVFIVMDYISEFNKSIIKSSNLGEYVEVKSVDYIHNYQNKFACTYGKFEAFNLTQYNKVIFLDADIILREDLDCLFQYDNWFAFYDDGGYYGGTFMVSTCNDTYNKCIRIIRDENNLYTNDESLLQQLDLCAQRHKLLKITDISHKLWHDIARFGARDSGIKYWIAEDLTLNDIKIAVDYFIKMRSAFCGFGEYVCLTGIYNESQNIVDRIRK